MSRKPCSAAIVGEATTGDKGTKEGKYNDSTLVRGEEEVPKLLDVGKLEELSVPMVERYR